MRRDIVKIDESKCDGCGQCATACAEGAIRIIDGKAKVTSDAYCDGLGACLGECPQGALTIEQRDAVPFDEAAALAQAEKPAGAHAHSHARPNAVAPQGHVCPGTLARQMKRSAAQPTAESGSGQPSELSQWPVQMKLVAPNAPYFQNADLLLAADCAPFALRDFHGRLLRGRAVVIGCPKLDDPAFYVEKLTAILKQSSVKSLTVAHMEVPCCFGLIRIAEAAIAASGKKIPMRDVTVTIAGEIRE